MKFYVLIYALLSSKWRYILSVRQEIAIALYSTIKHVFVPDLTPVLITFSRGTYANFSNLLFDTTCEMKH